MVPEHLRGPAAILQHTCQMESKLSDESIAIARTGVLPQDREFRCHLDCMLDKVGMVSGQQTSYGTCDQLKLLSTVQRRPHH